MTFDQFFDTHSDFVVNHCFNELPAAKVEDVSTAIVERAYRWFQEGKPADYAIRWSMATLIDEHRTPERRAELDAQAKAALAL